MSSPVLSPSRSALRPMHFRPKNGVRIVVWSAFAVILLVLPVVAQSSFALTLLCLTGIAAIACMSYNMLLGQAGMLSFGHAVYTGLGTFVAVHAMNRIAGGWWLPMWLIPLVGGIAGLAFGAILGFVTTRKAGTPFSMITLGVGELVFAAALMFPEFFGGEAGINANRTASEGWLKDIGITFGPQIQVYYLIALYLLICTAAMYAFTQTPLGRIANAVRDNPERAEFVGYDTRWVRYLVLMASAFFAGVAGGLTAVNVEAATSDLLHGVRSGGYLLFTFLGGVGFFFGPIVGSILLVFSLVVLSEFTKAWQLYVGIVFLIMVVFAPGGFSALIMLNLRRVKYGEWRKMRWPYAGMFFFGLVALWGFAALVEMAYQVQVAAGSGSALTVAKIPLDAASMSSWLVATAVLAVGGVGFEVWRRKFCKVWDDGEERIAEAIKKAEAAIV
ncbi:MAG: branched-chain amino acid ABC transporter permease [Burkholderiales bacterium]|nr:branched-chain amino acid ABC transporter permease [Burkholderiales bacterium]